MWHTLFVLSGPGRPGGPLPRVTQLRLDTARALCIRHPEIERIVFIGGAAPSSTRLSLAEHMKRQLERDLASSGRNLELVVRARSNTTAGNVREMGEAAAEFGLAPALPIVSRRAHFLRISRHARRLGLRIEPLTIEEVLGPQVMPPRGLAELLWTIRRRAAWLWELVDPDERGPAIAVAVFRRFTWRAKP